MSLEQVPRNGRHASVFIRVPLKSDTFKYSSIWEERHLQVANGTYVPFETGKSRFYLAELLSVKVLKNFCFWVGGWSPESICVICVMISLGDSIPGWIPCEADILFPCITVGSTVTVGLWMWTSVGTTKTNYKYKLKELNTLEQLPRNGRQASVFMRVPLKSGTTEINNKKNSIQFNLI